MDNKPKAIIFMIFSALSFAFMQAMVKLAGDIPVFEKVLFRNLVSLLVAFLIIRKNGASMFGKKENQKYLIARSLCGLSGVVLYFYAISNMLLADSSMLNKLSPFFVTIFAWIFLKEKLSAIQIPALLLVFIAALLIIKPSFSLQVLPGMAGVGSAITAGAAYTLVRHLKNKEEPSTIVFYFSFVSVVGMVPLASLNFVMPTPTQLIYLFATGIFAALGQFSLTYGYKYAPASEVSIFNYLSIVFSAIIGFIIFREVIDTLSLVGGIIIVSVAVMLFMNNKRRAKLNL